MRIVFIVLFLGLCMSVEAQDVTSSDSLNIPVLLVDGVEVQSLDSISAEDIIDFKVIKDEEVKIILSSYGRNNLYNDQVEEISYFYNREI